MTRADTTITIIDVIIDLPAYSQVNGTLSYTCEQPVNKSVMQGALVRVPLGKKEVLGIVWGVQGEGQGTAPQTANDKSFALKPVTQVFDMIPALSDNWCALVAFTAQYYQRSLGEVALQALPPTLRKLDAVQLQRRLKKLQVSDTTAGGVAEKGLENPPAPIATWPPLTDEQQAAYDRIAADLSDSSALPGFLAKEPAKPSIFLLQGATGSGKTEVYMRATQEALQQQGGGGRHQIRC